jgi:membrane-associated phospholipid phosphatase
MGPGRLTAVLRRSEKVWLCAGLFGFFLVGHKILNELAHVRPARYLPPTVEEYVPFLPGFIVIYLLAFGAVFVPALVIPSRHEFRRVARRFLALILVSFSFFLIFPFSVQRIESPVGDGWSLDLLRWFQSVAKPHNSFPSLHVAFIVLGAVSCLPESKRTGIGMFVFAALVALSTLFCKLHNVLDIVAGVAVAVAVVLALPQSHTQNR